jgi:adenosylcobinamide amidohydrolase
MLADWPRGYHERVCRELRISPANTALMATAANMEYAAVATERSGELTVRAIVTAGVHGNAGRAGDPACWDITTETCRRLPPVAGTINTMLLFDCALTEPALVRAVATMTEAKSAALADLHIGSRGSSGLATGTGTDQFCLAAPQTGAPPRTWTGKHTRIGELIGRAVLRATKESLRWQNGLELSLTRDMFHLLGRFGLNRETWLERLRRHAAQDEYVLLTQNEEAVRFDPMVAGCAVALAAVWDCARAGVLLSSSARALMLHQCALLVCELAQRPTRFEAYRRQLETSPSGDDLDLLARAVTLGWREKWNRSNS